MASIVALFCLLHVFVIVKPDPHWPETSWRLKIVRKEVMFLFQSH